MSNDLDEVLSRLPRLTEEELTDVKGRVTFLLSSGPGKTSTPSSDDSHLILDVLGEVLQSLGSETVHPAVLRKTSIFPAFKRKVPVLMEYVRAAGVRNEQRAVLRLGIEILYRYLEKHGPVSSRTIMQHIHRVPSAINRQFPGYAKSGLLRAIVRGELK